MPDGNEKHASKMARITWPNKGPLNWPRCRQTGDQLLFFTSIKYKESDELSRKPYRVYERFTISLVGQEEFADSRCEFPGFCTASFELIFHVLIVKYLIH